MIKSTENMIFVFGSNLSGYHGAGSARAAVKDHGAIYGQGEGLQGNSYALPTKGKNITHMSLERIAGYVKKFLQFASENPQLDFQVTCVGCLRAGYSHSEIAPLFKDAPSNCYFDMKWRPWLPETAKYWGTY